MGYNSEAQQKLDSAREHVKEAIKDLAEIVINECYGSNELDTSKMSDMLQRLIEMRNEL